MESDTLDNQDSEERGHLSERVNSEQWLRLLIVLACALLIAATIAVAVFLLMKISHTLLIFSLGALLAYALSPLVLKLQSPGVGKERKRGRAILLVYGGLLLTVGLGVALLSAEAVRQATHISQDHVKLEADARERLAQADEWLAFKNIKFNLEDTLNDPPPNVKSWGEAISHHVVKTLGEASKSVVEGFVVTLISLFFLLFGAELREKGNEMLPTRLKPYAEVWEEDVNHILGGFVRGQVSLALLMGAITAGVCLLCGVKFWLLISMFFVVVSLLPVFGPVIGTVPVILSAALFPGGPFPNPLVKVAVLLVLFVIINEFGSKILYPRLVGAALGLHEVLVLFTLFAGLEIGGLIGVLFAAPLTAIVIATCNQIHRFWRGEPPIQTAKRPIPLATSHPEASSGVNVA